MSRPLIEEAVRSKLIPPESGENASNLSGPLSPGHLPGFALSGAKEIGALRFADSSRPARCKEVDVRQSILSRFAAHDTGGIDA